VILSVERDLDEQATRLSPPSEDGGASSTPARRASFGSRPFSGGNEAARFSPDGTRLVYVRENSPLVKPAGRALVVARADGSGQQRITPWSLGAGDSPDWSPNGKLIVFRSPSSSFEGSQIYVVRPDGTGLRQLTRFTPGTSVLSYSFSPTGSGSPSRRPAAPASQTSS